MYLLQFIPGGVNPPRFCAHTHIDVSMVLLSLLYVQSNDNLIHLVGLTTITSTIVNNSSGLENSELILEPFQHRPFSSRKNKYPRVPVGPGWQAIFC